MIAHKLGYIPTADWTSRDEEILHQYKRRIFQKYAKEVLSNDYLFDLCSITLAELLSNTSETELVSCSALMGFEKPIRIALEKLMFNLYDEIQETKSELLRPYRIHRDRLGKYALDLSTGTGMHTSILKQFSGYPAQNKFLNEYAPFEGHLRVVQLTKAIIWRHIKKNPTLAGSICRSPGFQNCVETTNGRIGDDFNTPESLLAFMTLIVMICRQQRQDLPLAGELVSFAIADDYYRRIQKDVIAAVKDWKLQTITDKIEKAKIALMTFILNYVDLYQGLSFMKDSDLGHVLQHPVAFPTYDSAMPDIYDEEIAGLMDELEYRKALLPSNGVEYSVMLQKTDGPEKKNEARISVPDEICGLSTFYLHEVITEDNQLYLIIRQYIHEAGYSQLFIYKPTEKKVEFISRYRDKENGMYGDVISLCLALKVYKAALGLFVRHNEDADEDGDKGASLPKNVRKSVLYKEQRYIQHYKRRLPDGYNPSPESVAGAKAIGLVLGKNETYVRPHWKSIGRTTPEDAVVTPVMLTGLFSLE